MDSVYFVRADSGRIKIGRSADVVQRLTQLRLDAGEGVALIAAFPGVGRFERRVHSAVAADRIDGEWFRPSPAVMALAHCLTPEELMARIGATVPVAASASNPGATDQDRADLARADRMALEARALRRRVLSRIRQRNWRTRKDQTTTKGTTE